MSWTLSGAQSSLGHPEDEVELEKLMHDWDVKGRGFLDFDAFLSIVSSTLKVKHAFVLLRAQHTSALFCSTATCDEWFSHLILIVARGLLCVLSGRGDSSSVRK